MVRSPAMRREGVRQFLLGRLRSWWPPPQQSRRWVGLDVGTRSIKLAELEQTETGPRLIKTLVQELPITPPDQPVDRLGWLQSALREFDVRAVHLSVSGPQVAIRRIHIPLMSKRELPEAVKWEVRDHIPFSVQEAVLDFQVIGDVWEKDVKKQDVLVAVASKPLIADLIATVERSGAHVATVLPTHLALWRCVTSLIPEATQGSVAVIDVGTSGTAVTIANDGHIRLVRDLAVGSASFTAALVGAVAVEGGEITIDWAKAEALKRRFGLLTETTAGTTEEGLPLFHLASLMRPVLESLLTELGRLFDFYKVQMDERGVSRILLCGAGATLKQLQAFLADGLGMTVEIFNPLIRIPDRSQRMEPEQVTEGGPRLAVAIGLAMDHGQGLTLLPAESRRRGLLRTSRRVWLTAAKGLAMAAVALYVGLQLVALVLAQQIRSQQRVWAAVQPAYVQGLELASTCAHLEGTLLEVQRFLDQQPVWDGIFKEWSTLVPAAVELDEVTARAVPGNQGSPLTFTLSGRTASEAEAGNGSLPTFVEALEQSPFFTGVEMSSSELHSRGTGTSRFMIEGRLE